MNEKPVKVYIVYRPRGGGYEVSETLGVYSTRYRANKRRADALLEWEYVLIAELTLNEDTERLL